MMPGMNPSQMAGMMKKMGISQEQIDATRVIFETPEGKIVIDNPDVMKIKMQGQTSFQVTGDEEFISDDEPELYSEQDLKMVMEKTEKSEEEVRKSLEKNEGDIALTIMELKEDYIN
jgi:alpha-NAC-related protein